MGLFYCPLKIGASPEYYLANPVATEVADTPKASCSLDGISNFSFRVSAWNAISPGSYMNLRGEQDLSFSEDAPTGSGIDITGMDTTVKDYVFRWIVDDAIHSPSSDNERLAYFLVASVDYRTRKRAWSTIAVGSAIEIGDCMWDNTPFGTYKIYQCNTAHTRSSGTPDLTKWTDKGSAVKDFIYDPEAFSGWDMQKEEEVDGRNIFGFINAPSLFPNIGTISANFGTGSGGVSGNFNSVYHKIPSDASISPDAWAINSDKKTAGKLYWKIT
jgi:hypothetical protein